jgi:hypothetical protein
MVIADRLLQRFSDKILSQKASVFQDDHQSSSSLEDQDIVIGDMLDHPVEATPENSAEAEDVQSSAQVQHIELGKTIKNLEGSSPYSAFVVSLFRERENVRVSKTKRLTALLMWERKDPQRISVEDGGQE